MQSKMLNIPSYIEDPSYRYKMPALQLKIEGRGNGIKTKIVNLAELAVALRVPPAYPLKFLGHELGSQTNESQSVINGSFVEPELRKHLDKFIEKYVLCSSCKYPEMVLKIKHGVVNGACNSCGARAVLDNQHKLAAYILKNPPKDASEFKGDKKAKEGEKEKEKEKEKDKDASKKPKEDKEEKKQKHSEKEGHDKKGDSKEGQEEQKTGEVKHRERVKEEPAQILTVTFKDIEEDLISKAKQIYQQYASIENFDDRPAEVQKIIKAVREVVPEDHANKIPYILFNAIFGVNIAKEVAKNKAILNQAYDDLGIKNREFDTLLNLEKFLLVRNSGQNFDRYISTILKVFYDEDLLTEEFLLDWDSGKLNPKLIMDYRYLKPIDDRFKAASKTIISWLKEEEIEGEEDNPNQANGEAKEEEGDEDIDIDNI